MNEHVEFVRNMWQLGHSEYYLQYKETSVYFFAFSSLICSSCKRFVIIKGTQNHMFQISEVNS